jgi:hypothetical protein
MNKKTVASIFFISAALLLVYDMALTIFGQPTGHGDPFAPSVLLFIIGACVRIDRSPFMLEAIIDSDEKFDELMRRRMRRQREHPDNL